MSDYFFDTIKKKTELQIKKHQH